MKFPLSIVIALVFLSSVSYEAEGIRKNIRSVETEDLDLETQLKILNKPPIKSFKKDGETIDCVDIYKQPAFDHPLLKNHKLQLRPSSLPEGVKLRREDASKLLGRSESAFSSCPSGTVPFKRVVKEDLIRAKAALYLVRSKGDIRPKDDIPDAGQIHYAAISTPSQTFYGVRSLITLYNLSSIVAPQISEVMVWLGSGVDGPYNSIEYGWMVNPQLYGDTQTHTYSLWTADGQQKTGCYNTNCPGYVQVSQQWHMGDVCEPVTTPGGQIIDMIPSLFRDPNTSNWWLFLNAQGTDVPVGYWPKELFPKMADSAAVVQLGGKVFSPPDMTTPPMGSGSFISKDYSRTCFIDHIEFVDSNHQFYKPDMEIMNPIASDFDTYRVEYDGDMGERGCTMMFGGPHIELK